MDILEVFEDYITTTADELPYDMWNNNNLDGRGDIVEVGFDYKQVGDELTGEVFITIVTMGDKTLRTIHQDRSVMASYIQDHLAQMQEASKVELNGGW